MCELPVEQLKRALNASNKVPIGSKKLLVSLGLLAIHRGQGCPIRCRRLLVELARKDLDLGILAHCWFNFEGRMQGEFHNTEARPWHISSPVPQGNQSGCPPLCGFTTPTSLKQVVTPSCPCDLLRLPPAQEACIKGLVKVAIMHRPRSLAAAAPSDEVALLLCSHI